MFIWVRIVREGLVLTLQQLWANKLRSFLSLLGITIGIFSIISILTSVDALKNNINTSIQSLGKNVVVVSKWPWSFTFENYPWWKYFQRPESSYRDYRALRSSGVNTAKYLAYAVTAPKCEVDFRGRNSTSFELRGVSRDYPNVLSIDIGIGRFFSPQEENNGLPVCVVGSDIVDELMEGTADPIGREIKVNGRKVKIVGIVAKQGQNILGINFDNNVYVPYSYLANVNNINYLDEYKPWILVKGRDEIPLEEVKAELIGSMRALRRLRPKQEDNFSINEFSIISQGFQGVFKGLNLIGVIIGSFAIFIGAFGISNIMYVSVTERTNIIGIKKALGARRSYILIEYLLESVILCLLGGLLGIALVYFLSGFATEAAGMDFSLTAENAAIGIAASIVIGLLSGMMPANKASKLDPVEAIRSK